MTTISPFETFKVKIILKIEDSSLTRIEEAIPMLHPIISYIDTETQVENIFDDGPIKINSANAAVLRCTLNPDPSSFKPFAAYGMTSDSVLQEENKENTKAINVDYYSVVALISPIVDGTDLTKVALIGEVYSDYYKKNNFSFPFEDTKNFDYIDFRELSQKSVYLVAEWVIWITNMIY